MFTDYELSFPICNVHTNKNTVVNREKIGIGQKVKMCVRKLETDQGQKYAGILMRCVHYKFGKQTPIVQAFASHFLDIYFRFM